MYINIGSELKRKKWMREGLVQAASKSFWNAFTGNTDQSVIVQVNNSNASEGHVIVFDYDGNLTSKAIKGKATAYGQGEDKRKFSNKLTVDRYRLVANNGDAFDAVDIGNLALSQHSDSRSKLGDLFVRFKDQGIFDTLQGFKYDSYGVAQTPSHIIDLTATFDYNTLIDIERKLTMGTGFTTGAARRPLQPYVMKNGMVCWLFVVDPAMAAMLKKSNGYQAMVYQADIRGDNNRAISGVIGKVGNLIVVEAPSFFGTTDNATASTPSWDLNATSTEIAGMRMKDANGLWTGQTGYDASTDQISRGLLLGANAVQMGFGKMPDYAFQESQDFGITSESALETWMEMQKTKLVAETADYVQAKIAGIDWGVVAVDVKSIDV